MTTTTTTTTTTTNQPLQYYWRYEGTTIEPPCVAGTNWRVLKEAIKVAPSQIRRLEELLIDRVDPKTCRKSTAGTVNNAGTIVAVNRPIQTTNDMHELRDCECVWKSNSLHDNDTCKKNRQR
jgi:hypothetical protein